MIRVIARADKRSVPSPGTRGGIAPQVAGCPAGRDDGVQFRSQSPCRRTMLEFGHLTHTGLRRELNEDTYYGDSELGLWLVADGMGGHACGELASALARETIVREIRAGTPLEQAIRVADEEIIRASRRRNDTLPMGTTVVAARVQGNRFEVAWVGDSRAYLWREGRLAQLSQDHSYVQELVAQGSLTSEQARAHPHRNVVTQALGVTDPAHLNVATMTGELRPGMQLLLCSDGLTEEVDDAGIADTLAYEECSAQECVDSLVAAALDGGGSDNITAILVRCH
jgi:protein phosphatase